MTNQNLAPPTPEGENVEQLRQQIQQLATAVDHLTKIVTHRAEERSVEAEKREAEKQELNEKITAIGNFVDQTAERRDQEINSLFSAAKDRPTRDEFNRRWREYNEFSEKRFARMVDAATATHVGKLRDDVSRMTGAIETWGTYRDGAVGRLDARVTTLENDLSTLNQNYVELRLFARELGNDVRGNPDLPDEKSLSKDLRELRALIVEQQKDFNAKFDKAQADHRQEMTALRTKVDAQATIIDIVLALPRTVVNVVKGMTGIKSLPNGKDKGT